MDSGIELVALIEIVIGIIVLVVFFCLYYNVSQIKQKVAPKSDNFAYIFNLLLALGRVEDAQRYLIDTMIAARDERNPIILSQINSVLNKYSKQIEKAGLRIDNEFLDAIKKNS